MEYYCQFLQVIWSGRIFTSTLTAWVVLLKSLFPSILHSLNVCVLVPFVVLVLYFCTYLYTKLWCISLNLLYLLAHNSSDILCSTLPLCTHINPPRIAPFRPIVKHGLYLFYGEPWLPDTAFYIGLIMKRTILFLSCS